MRSKVPPFPLHPFPTTAAGMKIRDGSVARLALCLGGSAQTEISPLLSSWERGRSTKSDPTRPFSMLRAQFCDLVPSLVCEESGKETKQGGSCLCWNYRARDGHSREIWE